MLKKKLLALSLVLALGLTACGGDDAGDDTEAETPEVSDTTTGGDEETDETEAEGEDNGGESSLTSQPEPGEKDADQYFNTFTVEEPTTLNSAQGSDKSSFAVLTNIMEPLVRQVEDTKTGQLEIQPAAAESWETSDDQLTWTFHLRDGMKWSNGDPLTANDYEFGMKRALDVTDGAGGMGYLLSCIENANESMTGDVDTEEVGVTAVDDTTLEIKLVRETPYFLQLLSTRPTLPIHQATFEELGDSYGQEAEGLVTCGPFNITSWTHQSNMDFEKNPDYWDAENVYFDKVSQRIISEETTYMNAFLNGELDQISTTDAEWEEQFKAKEDVFLQLIKNPAVDYMFFNTEEKPYNNAKVRRAISAAINREESISAVYNDVGVPAYGLVMHGIAYEGEEWRQIVPTEELEAIIKEGDDPKALLEEGLKEEGMTPDEFTLNLEFGGTSQEMVEMGDYFIQSLEETLGTTVTVQTNEWAAFSDKVQNGDFQLGYMAWFADYNDPYHMLELMLSDVDGLQCNWESEEYDKLIEEALTTTDSQERLEKYTEAEKIIAEESPVIPILNSVKQTFRYEYLYGWQNSQFSTQGWKNMYTSGR